VGWEATRCRRVCVRIRAGNQGVYGEL